MRITKLVTLSMDYESWLKFTSKLKEQKKPVARWIREEIIKFNKNNS